MSSGNKIIDLKQQKDWRLLTDGGLFLQLGTKHVYFGSQK